MTGKESLLSTEEGSFEISPRLGFFRTASHWEETHEVVSVSAQGITIHVTVKGDVMSGVRTEQLSAPCSIASRSRRENRKGIGCRPGPGPRIRIILARRPVLVIAAAGR
jgi:hypothetical protein